MQVCILIAIAIEVLVLSMITCVFGICDTTIYMHVFHCFLDSCMKSIIYVHINFQILNLVHLYPSLVKVSCDRVVNEKWSFVHLNADKTFSLLFFSRKVLNLWPESAGIYFHNLSLNLSKYIELNHSIPNTLKLEYKSFT